MEPLPDSLIIKVFSYLSLREKLNTQAVCKAWRMLLQDFTLWTNIDTGSDVQLAAAITDDILGIWLVKWGCHIRTLRLRHCSQVTDQCCLLIADNCPNITFLDIQGCMGIGDPGILSIARACKRIQKANLFMTKVTDFGCGELLKSVVSMSGLKLPSKGNSYRILKCLTENCQDLRELVVSDIIPMNKQEPVVSDFAITNVAETFPMLTKLSLSWCWYITDECLISVARNCLGLRNLVVSECPQVSDDGVRMVINSCEQLQKLYLGRLYNVTDRVADGFEGKKLSLRWLKMIDTSITDRGLSKILKNSPELRGLRVGEYCYNASKISGEIVYSCSKYCKKLIDLSVVSSRVIDDFMLREIGENLPKLKVLLLSSCQGVGEFGLKAICFGCRELEELRICECNGLTDEILGEITDSLKSIKSIDIYGCKNITESCIHNIVKRKPNCRIRI